MSLGFTKILRDLWLNRAHTSLVVLAIALSVMAFGVLNTTRTVMLYNFTTAYVQAVPAHATLALPDFNQKLLNKVRSLPEVRLAEGRRQFYLTLKSGDTLRTISASASPDPVNTRIGRLAWGNVPPAGLGKGEVLLDRSFQTLMPVATGQALTVQAMDGNRHDLRVTGLPNDLISMSSEYSLMGQAFVNLDTAERLGQERDYNQLLIVTQASGDNRAALQAEVRRQVTRVVDAVEDAGYPVLAVELPMVGQPPLDGLVRALLLTLQLFGLLIVLLAVLVVRHTPGANGSAVIDRLFSEFDRRGYSVVRIDYVPQMNADELASYDVIIYSLFAVVALTALVGGLGLLSTLSISVMERRREIGILRSMGARPARIRRLVITEGLLIGLLSLPLSFLLSWPLTLALGEAVVIAIAGVPPQPVYLPGAALAWAGLVSGLALLSSWVPARQAGRLSIREALIYQG